jgi:predicted nucleotidyltransferase
MSKAKVKRLSKEKREAILTVRRGADVYSYSLAKTLRQIEKDNPGLIEIGKPQMYRGDGTDRMPYFGCIATPKGLRLARAKAGAA